MSSGGAAHFGDLERTGNGVIATEEGGNSSPGTMIIQGLQSPDSPGLVTLMDVYLFDIVTAPQAFDMGLRELMESGEYVVDAVPPFPIAGNWCSQ